MQRRISPIHRIGDHLLVTALEERIVHAHGFSEAAEQFRVGHAFALGFYRAIVITQIKMPPREHDFFLFHLRGRGQHDVGIARRVGDEMLADDGEQILAQQAFDDFILLRRNHQRIGVVHADRFNRRIELHFAGQCLAELPLVQHARAGCDEIGPHQITPIHRESPNRQLQNAAADVPPCAHQRGQASQRAHRLAAVAMALDGHADADHRRLRGRVIAREFAHVVRRNAGDARDFLRRIILRALGKFVEAHGVVIDVIFIDQAFRNHHVDHAHGECRVGAGANLDVPIGVVRGARFHRIDDDHFRAAFFRCVDDRPMMQVGADRIARPQNDVFRMRKTFGIGARRRADGHHVGRARTGIAEGALADRRAEFVKKRIANIEAIQNALGAEIAIRKNRRRPRFRDDCFPTIADFFDRLIPRDALELPAALRPFALERMHHAIGAVHALFVVIDFHAQSTVRVRMIRIAAHFQNLVVVHRHDHRTSVGTIVRASGNDITR